MKNIVVGVSGGVAAYKALQVVSGLRKMGHAVKVIMTENAAEFVTPLSFQSVGGGEVVVDMFERPAQFDIKHISWAQWADVFLVAPATANIIGKVAQGIADDMLSTTIMAVEDKKVIFAPAMNTRMYLNPIVQRNIRTLKEYGYGFIEPAEGLLACGDTGVGKLQDPEIILDYLEYYMAAKDMAGRRVLITAGATKSLLDPVRYISNFSSGKMGFALAKESRNRGAEVTLISGETYLAPIPMVETIFVRTNKEMKDQVEARFDQTDMVIMSAAVLDYKVAHYAEQKIKKGEADLTVTLQKDTDILYTLGKKKSRQLLVGFAAESENLIKYATQKMERKNLDFIVANDITLADSGFNSDFNTVSILSRDGGVTNLKKKGKDALAKDILDAVVQSKATYDSLKK